MASSVAGTVEVGQWRPCGQDGGPVPTCTRVYPKCTKRYTTSPLRTKSFPG